MSEQEIAMFERMIEMLGSAGEGAFWLILAWVGKGYFVPVLTAGSIIGVVWIIAKMTKSLVGLNAFSEDAMRAAGFNPYSTIRTIERNEILSLIRKGRQFEQEGAKSPRTDSGD